MAPGITEISSPGGVIYYDTYGSYTPYSLALYGKTRSGITGGKKKLAAGRVQYGC